MQSGPWGPREPRSNALIVAAFVFGAIFWSVVGCQVAKAATAPPDLVTVARDVSRLPPGPGGYGHDCIWRTQQVIARLRGYEARRQDVSWAGRYGNGCHAVASVWIGEDEWMVDGQSGMVVRTQGEWAGPFHIDNCAQAVGR